MKALGKKNVLMFTRTMGLGGTENVVLQLCQILKPQVNNIVVCSCGGVNVKKLTEIGIKHYEIPDIERKKIKVILDTLKILYKIIHIEKISIVHTHHRMAAFYTCLLKNIKKFTFFCTAHNTFEDKRLLTRFSYHRAKVIACGVMVKKNLTDFYGIPEKNVTVIHNAVAMYDGEKKDDETLMSLKKNGMVLVGNVGRLSKQKGMEYFIESYSKVKDKYRDVKYIIVGDGEDADKLKELARKQGIENDIVFMGYRSDIQNVIRQLDFVVLSSLWEGLPLTPIEAFSVHKTVIGTEVDGTVEIIKDGKNGFLIPAKDSDAIAEKVCVLLGNPELRKRLEEEAYRTYVDKFCFERFAEKVLSFYELAS